MKDSIGQEVQLGNVVTFVKGSSAYSFGECLPVVVAFGNANNIGVLMSTYKGEPNISWVKPELCIVIDQQVKHFNEKLYTETVTRAEPFITREKPKKAVTREYFLLAYPLIWGRENHQYKPENFNFQLLYTEGTGAKEHNKMHVQHNKRLYELCQSITGSSYPGRRALVPNREGRIVSTYGNEKIKVTDLKKILPNFEEFLNSEITGESLDELRNRLTLCGANFRDFH